MPPQTDVLLVTVTPVETRTLLAAIKKINGEIEPEILQFDKQIYQYLGIINNSSIVHMQCEMGTVGLGAASQAISQGIRDLSPGCVIMVGIAFGVNPRKQKIGDVLVSGHLYLYEPQKINEVGNIFYRGSKVDCSSWLLQPFRILEARREPGPRLQVGLVLSGEKLIDNLDFREGLLAREPEAIGGEMEGAGLYVACHSAGVDWILVKGICDWADGNKSLNKNRRQERAATNAAHVVAKALTLVSLKRQEVAPRPFEESRASKSNISYHSSDAFVGRESELTKVQNWALSDTLPWVYCLWGTGGIGKTRLAEEVARRLFDHFDLVWKVSFEAFRPDKSSVEKVEVQQIYGEIALSLGAENVNEAIQLHEFIKKIGVRALLILDNFETVENINTVRGVANLAASGIKCLVTSRNTFPLSTGVENWQVSTLTLPLLPKEDFMESEAAILFSKWVPVESPLRNISELKESEREAFLKILHITDGLPLAIQMVAANVERWRREKKVELRATGKPESEWLNALADSLNVSLIEYSKREAVEERHKKIGACFQWSLNLLPKKERKRFVTLCIFPYDFNTDSVIEICDVSKADLSDWKDRSVIHVNEDNRWFLVSLFREYMWGNLTQHSKDKYKDKIVNYFIRKIDSFLGEDKNILLYREYVFFMRYEIKTILYCRQNYAEYNSRNYLLLSNVQNALLMFGFYHELFSISRENYDLAKTIVIQRLDEANRGQWVDLMLKSMCDIGIFHLKMNNWDLSRKILSDAVEYSRFYKNRVWESFALSNLGEVFRYQGRWSDAVLCFENSMSINEDLNDFNSLALNLNNIGICADLIGDYKKAVSSLKESTRICTVYHNDEGLTNANTNLSAVYVKAKEFDKAQEILNTELQKSRILGDMKTEAILLANLGIVYVGMKKWDESLEVYKKCYEVFNERNDVFEKYRIIVNIANVYREKGDVEKAIELCLESIKCAEIYRDYIHIGHTWMHIAICYEDYNDIEKAFSACLKSIDILSLTEDTEGLRGAMEILEHIKTLKGS
ncbi:MAG: tetratricopeptide repeat protein [Armatimonas sp.]